MANSLGMLRFRGPISGWYCRCFEPAQEYSSTPTNMQQKLQRRPAGLAYPRTPWLSRKQPLTKAGILLIAAYITGSSTRTATGRELPEKPRLQRAQGMYRSLCTSSKTVRIVCSLFFHCIRYDQAIPNDLFQVWKDGVHLGCFIDEYDHDRSLVHGA